MRLNDHGECRVEIKRLREKNAKLQAECAAMRSSLELQLRLVAGAGYKLTAKDIKKALASDAGAKMLEYVESLENSIHALCNWHGADVERTLALKRELGR